MGDVGRCRVIELSRVKQPSDDQEDRLWGFNVWRHLYFQWLGSKNTTPHGAVSATVRTITIENAGFELALVQWLVLRHELRDQRVLDRRIIASYGLIASLVTMSCRLLLRRAASRGVLPRERFRPMVRSRRTLSPLVCLLKRIRHARPRSCLCLAVHAEAPQRSAQLTADRIWLKPTVASTMRLISPISAAGAVGSGME